MSVTAIMAVREPTGVAPATRGSSDGFADVLATVSDTPRPADRAGSQRAGSERPGDGRATQDRTAADRGAADRGAAEGPVTVAGGDAEPAQGSGPVGEQPAGAAVPSTGDLSGLVAELDAAAAEVGPVAEQPAALLGDMPHDQPVAPAGEQALAVAPAVTAPAAAPAPPASVLADMPVAVPADDLPTAPAAGPAAAAGQIVGVGAPASPVSAPVAGPVAVAQPGAANAPAVPSEDAQPAAPAPSASTEAAVTTTTPQTPAPAAPAGHGVAHAPVSGPSPTAPAAPAPAPAPVPTPAPPMVDQLGAHLRALVGARAGTHVLSVALDPKNLGEVRIVAHISSGQVRIDLAGANDAARAALRGTLDELRRDLQSAGLEAELGLADERSERGTKDGPRTTTARPATTEQDAGDRDNATPIDLASGHSLDLVV